MLIERHIIEKNYVNSIILHMQQNRSPVQYRNLAYKEPTEKYVDGVHLCISPTRNLYTKLCEHSSRISKNGTRVETRYVEICT